ncbi:hypothetical protein AgCh_039385 [Apium graveolens]
MEFKHLFRFQVVRLGSSSVFEMQFLVDLCLANPLHQVIGKLEDYSNDSIDGLARSLPIDKLRPACFIINAFIYFIQWCKFAVHLQLPSCIFSMTDPQYRTKPAGVSDAVPTAKGQVLADEYGIQFFETSAKTNLNAEQVFYSIARDIKQRLADTESKAEVIKLI